MTLPPAPPDTTVYSVRRGSEGWPVFALQAGLNSTQGAGLVEDGDFGPATEAVVKSFQKNHALTVDGVAGPVTQSTLVGKVLLRADKNVPGSPQGFLRGLVLAESGGLLGAVNHSVSGGTDCGIVQRRVYTPYSISALKSAFSPLVAAQDALRSFDARRDEYLGQGWVGTSNERAGRCAALAHNWPAGALSQAKYGHVPSPDTLATWVPQGVRFPDGAPVRTRQEWGQFYALGGPHGEGHVTYFVTSW